MTTMRAPRTAWAPDQTFDGFVAPDIAALTARARVRIHRSGSLIFGEGDAAGGLHFLQKGLVKLYRLGEGGQEALLALLGPGDFFGEVAALDGGPQPASAQAVQPSLTLEVPREVLLAFLEEHPGMARRLCVELAGRLRSATKRMVDARLLPLRPRLAARLRDLAARFGRESGGQVELSIPLRQRDLAGMVGATRESVNRTLGEMEHEGLVRLGRGHLVLRRPDQLQ